MKKKFHFKETFTVTIRDILWFLRDVTVIFGLISLIPFIVAIVLTYLKISTFETTFTLSIMLETLIAGVCCLISDLKQKCYY